MLFAPVMTTSPIRLTLASRSPRRRQLLAEAGYRFDVFPPEESVECALAGEKSPRELVTQLAYRKAADVARRIEKGVILGCDTVVQCDGRILGKPTDGSDARNMLFALRGREHSVYSGLCLWQRPDGEPAVRVAVTLLRMDRLDDARIDDYVASGSWRGKAGAFGYQDRLGWVHIIRGSESNVVGLPLELLAEMLAQIEEPSP